MATDFAVNALYETWLWSQENVPITNQHFLSISHYFVFLFPSFLLSCLIAQTLNSPLVGVLRYFVASWLRSTLMPSVLIT